MKIRAGLYTYEYKITDKVKVTYTVEFNPEGLSGFENKWAVSDIITGNREDNWFERPFNTKKAAIQAIKEIQENGHYKYTEGLGWCYYDN